MLTVSDSLDERLLALPAHRLYQALPGPTLIHLTGRLKRPLFVTALQHGNETSGWEAVRALLSQYRGKTLPRSLSIFIANVRAARYGKRKLADQPDFNRVWEPEVLSAPAAEAAMMREVFDAMARKRVFASIDVHNNSGFNPHYACVNRLAPGFLQLAAGFSRSIVYFIRPRGVQSQAFARLCPAVTLECGRPGDEYGVQLATRFLDSTLNLKEFHPEPPDPTHYDLFHTMATVKMPEAIRFSFDGSEADVRFIQGIEQLNFEEINSESVLARVKPGVGQPLHVLDESGKDIYDDFFKVEGDTLINRKPVIPSMLSTDISIVRDDCLCYLMERYDLAWGEKQAR